MRALHLTGLSMAILAGFTTSLLAHPGHGMTDPDSVVHPVVEPIHGGWVLLGLVLFASAAVAWKVRSQKTARLPVRGDGRDRNGKSTRN